MLTRLDVLWEAFLTAPLLHNYSGVGKKKKMLLHEPCIKPENFNPVKSLQTGGLFQFPQSASEMPYFFLSFLEEVKCSEPYQRSTMANMGMSLLSGSAAWNI